MCVSAIFVVLRSLEPLQSEVETSLFKVIPNSLFTMAEQSLTTSTPVEAARRRVRRSSCIVRYFSGVPEELTATPDSGEEDFFGDDTLSAEEAPPAKRPCVSDSWHEPEEEEEDTPPPTFDETATAEDDEPGDQSLLSCNELREVFEAGCDCPSNHYAALSVQSIAHAQEHLSGATRQEKDCFLLGLLSARMAHADTQHARSGVSEEERQRTRFVYTVHGHVVCRAVFCTIYNVGSARLKRLQKLAESGSFLPEAHKLKGRTPVNVYPPDVATAAVEFIKNYASIYGLPMPAAPRGRAQTPPTYLPASCTYTSVHAEYVKAQGENQAMKLKSFQQLWHSRVGNVKFMRPTQDVCATCEQLRDDKRSAKSEEEKVASCNALKKHVSMRKWNVISTMIQ